MLHFPVLCKKKEEKSISSSSAGLTAAEFRIAVMVAYHNAVLFIFDHICQMLRKNLPDSKITKSYHCGRTKIAYILNYALVDELIDALKK